MNTMIDLGDEVLIDISSIADPYASINDLPISDADRKFHWPLGRRPDGRPGLTALGL